MLSLGAFEGERLEGQDDLDIPPETVSKVFNDCRAEARRLFASYYKNNDRDPPNEEEDYDYLSQIQKHAVSSFSFLDFSAFSFDIRRRLKTDNPFDKNGEECKNNFGKLFKIGGTS